MTQQKPMEIKPVATKPVEAKQKSKLKKEESVDNCWHMAIICALVLFMTSATIRSAGFLYIGIMEEFNVDRGQASWPICLMGAVNNLVGIVAGPLCQKFTVVPVLYAGSVIMWLGILGSSFAPTITWITITQGVIFGFGSGIIFMMLPVFINQYFDKYKGLALGIMYTGSTSSAFVFPKLLLFLKETYNFRSSIRIFGAIVMHVTAISLILKEPIWIRRKRYQAKLAIKQARADVFTVENGNSKPPLCTEKLTPLGPDPGSLKYGFTVLRAPMFYVVLVTYIVYGYNFDVFMTTVVDFARDRGTSLQDAVALVPLFSVTDTVGRLCLPVLADRGYLRRSTLVMINYIMMGSALMVLPWATSYAVLVTVSCTVSIFIGCGMTMYPAIMAEYVGIPRLPISYGIVGTVSGPLFILKPFLIGYFRDHVGSYDSMYRLLATALLVVGFIWFVVVCIETRKARSWNVDHTNAPVSSFAGDGIYCQPAFSVSTPYYHVSNQANQCTEDYHPS